MSTAVTMQDLELEHAELLPRRETLCCCRLYLRCGGGPCHGRPRTLPSTRRPRDGGGAGSAPIRNAPSENSPSENCPSENEEDRR